MSSNEPFVKIRSLFTALAICYLLSLVYSTQPVWARDDPLKNFKDQVLRTDVIFVMDRSGSMSQGDPSDPDQRDKGGPDCLGTRTGDVDICGDGMCTGNEHFLYNAGNGYSYCAADCNNRPEGSLYDHHLECGRLKFGTNMARSKQMFRNVLPALRKYVRFGLVSHHQSGYFQYIKADTSSSTKKNTVMFSEWELRNYDGWDMVNNRPSSQFTWTEASQSYFINSDSAGSLGIPQDSLYARADDVSVEKRFPWSGQKFNDGGQTWLYRGTYYSYDQYQAPKKNRPRRRWSWWGWGGSSGSIIKQQFQKYLGPQFRDGSGDTWYYDNFRADTQGVYSYTSSGYSASCSGEAPVMVPINPSNDQSEQDGTLGDILARFNTVQNGGIVSSGSTPIGPAMAAASSHFAEVQSGTGAFHGVGPDEYAGCRNRIVVLVTDGGRACSNSTIEQIVEHVEGMRTNQFASNPIKTFVLLTPGTDTEVDISGFNEIAAAGGTGEAILVENFHQFTEEFKNILEESIRGSYVSSSPVTGTSDDSTIAKNLSFVTTLEAPKLKGNVLAYDHRKSPSDPEYLAWDAAEELAKSSWKDRKLYIGSSAIDEGESSALIGTDGSGVININGCAACGPSSLTHIWQAATGESTTPVRFEEFIATLVSQNEVPTFAPFVNNTPVVIGAPGRLDAIPEHSGFQANGATREKLIYVASDSGFIHAIRQEDGTEAFAFFPAVYLKRAYEAFLVSEEKSIFHYQYIAANSLRAYDTMRSGDWQTHLFATQGAGGSEFTVLDVTAPNQNPPVRVYRDSLDLSDALGAYLGETRSIPAMYYERTPDNLLQTNAGMGSGYRYDHPIGGYLEFQPVGEASGIGYTVLDGPVSQVDFGVTANTVAIVDEKDSLQAIATYQADLRGTITRFEKGSHADNGMSIISAGPESPFYFPPAAVKHSDSSEFIAAISGSYYETDDWMSGDDAVFQSKIFLQSHNNIGASVSRECKISDLCGACGFGSDVGICTSPGENALPVTQPMIVYNSLLDETDIFYLLNEPSGQACGAGKSWFVALRVNRTGNVTVRNSRSFDDEFFGGMALAGNNEDVIFSRSVNVHNRDETPGNVTPSVSSLTGELLVDDSANGANGEVPAGVTSHVEHWHEVR